MIKYGSSVGTQTMKQTWIESTDIPSSCIRSLWPQMVTGVTRHLALDTKCNWTNFLCIYIHYRCRNCKSTLARTVEPHTINFVWLSVASQAQEYRQRCILCFLINHSHCMLSTEYATHTCFLHSSRYSSLSPLLVLSGHVIVIPMNVSWACTKYKHQYIPSYC